MNKFTEPWLYLIQSLTAKCFATSRCHPLKMIFEWGAKTTRPGGVANRTPSQPPSYRSRSLPPARETLGTRWTLSSEDMRRGAFIKKGAKSQKWEEKWAPRVRHCFTLFNPWFVSARPSRSSLFHAPYLPSRAEKRPLHAEERGNRTQSNNEIWVSCDWNRQDGARLISEIVLNRT